MPRYALPALVFFGLLVLFGLGLNSDPGLIPSPYIDKPAPPFALPQLRQPDRQISHADLQGEASLLNVWASWCVACRHEHELLLLLSRKKNLRIIGLNYKDERADALDWLARLGDPYEQTAYDYDGKVGIDFGVYGVPETFVLDKNGVIRYKHVGPLTQESLMQTIYPLLRQLQAASLDEVQALDG